MIDAAADKREPGSRIELVRGIPVRITGTNATAVQLGWFPVSSTGFRSFAGRGRVTQSDLEEAATENDQSYAAVLRRIRGAGRQRVGDVEQGHSGTYGSLCISIMGAIIQAVGHSLFGSNENRRTLLGSLPALERRMLEIAQEINDPAHIRFREAAQGSRSIDEAGFRDPAHIRFREAAQDYAGVCRYVSRHLPVLSASQIHVEPWLRFAGALPRCCHFPITPLQELPAVATMKIKGVVPSSSPLQANSHGQLSLF